MYFFKKKKIEYKYPEKAKYKLGDYINFRYNKELYFGYVCSAKLNNNEISYTVQIEGQCPSFIYNLEEFNVIGIKED